MCALIYQVLWLRTLGWVFGVTVYAASAVWATFMAGLAAGSFAAGRIGDRVRHPLRWFGAIEILIGATALATPFVLAWLQHAYAAVHPSLPQSPGTLTAVRLAMAFAVLIVPTALMGTTLPLVVKASELERGALGGHVGLFPGTTAWVGGGLLVGSVEPLRLRRSDFDWKLQSPGRARGLRDLNIESFDALLAAFTAGPDELRAFVGRGPLLTDDRPLAEYFLSLPRDRDPDLGALKGDVGRYVVPD